MSEITFNMENLARNVETICTLMIITAAQCSAAFRLLHLRSLPSGVTFGSREPSKKHIDLL